jgi:hypothetical protein
LFCVRISEGRPDSLSVPLRNELSDDWDELGGHLHHGAGGGLIRRLVLGYRFLVGLRFVVFENATNALLVPANGIL